MNKFWCSWRSSKNRQGMAKKISARNYFYRL